MPQRFLKPGITTSRKWDSCSWQAQSFYIRLLTLVDDFGRYDGDPMLLRSHAFPLRDDIKTSTISTMCSELAKAGLANFYTVSGKDYVQLLNWTERPRASVSRYPEQIDNQHLQTNVVRMTTNDVNPQENAEESCLPRSSVIVPRSSTISHTPLQLRLCGWFNRKPETHWSPKEIKAVRLIEEQNPEEADVAMLEAYYAFKHPASFDPRRRDILTLLNNWPGELDRARSWSTKPKQTELGGKSEELMNQVRQAAGGPVNGW
jgi:hypothetical protein